LIYGLIEKIVGECHLKRTGRVDRKEKYQERLGETLKELAFLNKYGVIFGDWV